MENSKIITYDLCSDGKNYEDLYKYLKSFPHWARITESTWFVSSKKSCVKIRDEIKSFTDSDDRIFVAVLTGEAAWSNCICKSDYLKKYL